MKKIDKKELREKIFNNEDIDCFDYSEVTDMSGLLKEYKGNTIPYIDTSNVTNMNYMFSKCTNLKTIPPLDTSNVTSMMGTFYFCETLETIPTLNTSKVRFMNEMFYCCHSLTHLPYMDISSLENSPQTKNCVEFMFFECEKMKLELSNWKYEYPELFFKMFSFPDTMLKAFHKSDIVNLLWSCKIIDDFAKNTLISSNKPTQTEYSLLKKLNSIVKMDIPF